MEGEDSKYFFTILRGKVKLFKTTPAGKEIILAILGPGAPVGAVAVYAGHPYPASAEAFEDALLIRIPAMEYFNLLEEYPSFTRSLLGAITYRLMELNHRFPELAGGNVESRFARLFLKLREEIGRADGEDTFVPLRLSRQELADFTGTTIESSIRIMSRWGKDGIVETVKDGFVIRDSDALRRIASA